MNIFVLVAALVCCSAVAFGVTSVPITNFVNVNGVRFATLDNMVADTATSGCQSTPLLLPAGWTISKSNTNSMLAVMSYRWGTTCLVMSDGTSYSVRSGASCGTSQLSGTATLGYKATGCDRRILITQAGQATDVDITVGPAITHQVVVNRQVYATLDNADPLDKSIGCQTAMLRLPTGWTIATDVDNSHVVMLGNMYQFGTACLVLSNGNAYSVSTGASCGTLTLQKYATIYYAPVACDRRILITRAATASEPDTWSLNVPITNFAVAQGYAFAVMDNTSPYDNTIGCQSRAINLPTGWTIAKSSAGVNSIVTSTVFGTTCFVLADGTSLYRDGTPCGTGQLVTYKTYYAVSSCDRRVLITRAATTSLVQRPAVARTLGMKMLLISGTGDATLEGQLGIMRQAMQSMAIPYDEYAISPNANAPAGTKTGTFVLRNTAASTLTGYYTGFIATTDYVVHGLQVDSLSQTNLLDLNLYLQQFGARMVVMYSYPSGRGVTINPTYASRGGDDRTIRLNAGYASKATSFPTTFSVAMTGVWSYPATVTDATIATSVIEFVDPANTATLQGCAAAIFNSFDGREEMHFFLDQATWSLSSQALISLWAPWVSRNVYLGSRRLVLSPQIDDLFLDTEVWDPTQQCSCGTPSRVTSTDMAFLSSFATSINTANKGSAFAYGFAFNGNGVTEAGGPTVDTLYKWVKANINAFNWESHTFTHRDLTANDDGDVPMHNTTYAEALGEMTLNQAFGNTLFGTSAKYDKLSLVNPAITGMFNGNALKAIWDAGLRYLVGDNSRPELRPVNPYHGLYTTADFNGFAGLLIVPREATDVYYDCSTEAQLVDEYSHYYLSYWGRQLTLAEIMQNDAARTVRNLLAFRHDPYMFHQANLRVGTFRDPTTNSNTQHSLLTLWTRYVFMNLRKVSSLPVVSKDHYTLAMDLLAREALDNCNASGTMTMDTTGKITAVSVSSVGACKVGVTGVSNAVTGGTVETYGPDVTSWVPMTAGQTRSITLTTPIQFA